LGSCGRPCCCSSFLNGFERVSIKMAKVQGLSLNPVNISGLCGRLMCCLKYENEHYLETTKLMPKVNDVVTTPDGQGKVEALDLLKRTVKVQFSDENGSNSIKVYDLADLGITKRSDDAIDEDDLVVDIELAKLEDDLVVEEEQQPQQKPQQENRHNQKNKKFNNKDFGKKDGQKKEEKHFKKERQDNKEHTQDSNDQQTENKQQRAKKHKRHKNKKTDGKEKQPQLTQQE